MSVGELGRTLGLGEFEVTKVLFQLVQSKHVTMQRPRLRGGPIEVVETANLVLREIHQEADTAGKGTILRTALASFADGTYEVVFQRRRAVREGHASTSSASSTTPACWPRAPTSRSS
jgi:hypothetical protein